MALLLPLHRATATNELRATTPLQHRRQVGSTSTPAPSHRDQRSIKEPSKLFESMVVVGLHPNTDVQSLLKLLLEKSNEDTKKPRSLLNFHHQVHAELNLEPQCFRWCFDGGRPLQCPMGEEQGECCNRAFN